MISIIILAHNEEAYILSIIQELQKQVDCTNYEIILADGKSTDNTIHIAEKHDVKVVNCRKGRAKQMNDAALHAKGDILFFVHADMKFQKHTLATIEKTIQAGHDGGGFANLFDQHNAKIKRIGTWMNFRFFDNKEQSDRGIFYGDNGIFVKKKVFEALGKCKEIPIMEDYDLSVRMSKEYKTTKIKEPPIIVSARRHIKAGFLKTRFQWIVIRQLYKWGVSPTFLVKLYRDVR